MSSISFLRSSSSSAVFFAALDFAVDLDAFEAAFLVRLGVDEDFEDFFRDRAVSFEVFFVVMSALYHSSRDRLLGNHNQFLKNVAALTIVVLQ